MRQKDISNLAMKPVLSLADGALSGLQQHVTLDLKYVTEIILRGKLDRARQTNAAYQDGKSMLGAAYAKVNAGLTQALAFAQVLRDLLKPKFGSQYSKRWNAVGFFNRTLRLPRTASDAVALLRIMELFLKAHPEFAVTEVATAEIAVAVADALQSACNGLKSSKSGLRQKKKVRDQAMDDLRQALMQLRRELSMLLEDNDPRWLAFGFNVPADVCVPSAPEGLTVSPALPGEADLSWGQPTNTDRFHVWQQIVGVDEEPVRVATVTSTSKKVTELTTGAQVKFYVTAVNAAGESLPSEIVEMIVT